MYEGYLKKNCIDKLQNILFKTWRRLISNCVLQVKGDEAKAVCGKEMLAGGVDAVIEGGIHAMSLL